MEDTVAFFLFETQLPGLKPLLMAHTNVNVESVALRNSLLRGEYGGTERLKGRCSLCIRRRGGPPCVLGEGEVPAGAR